MWITDGGTNEFIPFIQYAWVRVYRGILGVGKILFENVISIL